METGKPGCAPVQISSVAAQTEKRMDIQAPLTAVYFHTVPALAAQPYQQPPAAAQEPATLHLAMPPLYSKETLPFLTLHIAGGMHSPPGLSLTAAAPTARPKSAGKHVCPHCGRDCMKPSVLEKHLRCHTGERPYPCTTCGVSFKTQSNLYKHKRTQAHARISSESEQSSVGSLDSMSSSRETHSSSLSLDEQSEDTGRAETDAAEVTGLATTTNVCSVQTQGSVCEQNEMTPAGRNRDPSESAKVRKVDEKTRVENEQPPLTAGRHLPLQRQKATLFSKQWESSVSRGQSQQSHESTDSGFSECSDHHLSPVSVLPDHGMDSLTESNKEHLEETTNTQAPSEAVKDAQEPKGAAREQEQRSLEERISKLISENTAVVEDKQLENVRPRKTVLSKQGSIDLPMPYTYKDSFHFDMRISKTQNVASQRNRKPGLYSSVPTQHSTTMEHAPLIRSNSLPFSVTLLQPERSSPASSCQSDYVTLVRRGSSGQINPVGFKPVSQQSAAHRPLVRQTAVDCNHATDGPFMNSSVEEASSSSLSCDGEAADTCGEPSNRKFRRKKAQKFAYNKWYMYGGGTFKKLYSAEQGVDNSVIKGRKCVNPVHEGPQKRLSAVHKETNITCSGATVCHPGCPPPMSCMVSAVDSTVRTSQIYSLCSSLNSPIQRNLSLSIPQLPSAASPLSKTPDGKSSADAGTLVGDEKHAASTSLLCGAHVPSDRKKQRTDDKMISPNALTHHPPSGTGSAPQQDATFSFIDFQKHPKQTALTGALFSPCLISARVSSRPATSNAPTAKTSFLPKYQLKLPNAAETESKTSHQTVVDTGRETCGCTFTSPLSSSRPEQTSTVVTAPEKTSSGAFTSSMMQTGDLNKTNAFNSTQAQLLSPCTATTFYPAETSRFSEHVTSSLTAVHQQFAAATITTTCRQDYQAGTCSTLIQPSKCAPVQLHTPAAPVVTTLPASIMTANSETSAAVPQCQPNSNSNPPLSHAQVVTTTVPLNPANKTNNSKVPCHVVPFDQVQPAAQNVFHVHTADLQICLQIISDEQLALIEPQIERQVDSSLSHRHDMEALTPERVEDKALKENSATKESGNEGRKQPGQRKEVDQSKSLPTVHMETMTPPTVCPLPNIHMPEHTNSSQATASADPKPREAQGLISHPHKCSHVNTVRETLSSAIELMSNAASLEGARTGRGLVSEAERPLPLDQCAEEQLVLHRGGRSGGPVIQSLPDQHKLSMTCRTGSQLPGKETEPKRDQGASSNDSIMGNKDETFAHNGSRLTSVETFPSTHSNFRKGSGGASEPSGSDSFLSVSKCKSPRHMSPQASGYSNPPEPTLSDTAKPLNDENWVCDRMGTLDNSAPLLETDRSSSAQKQVDQFTSVSSTVQVERSKDIPAEPISVQTPPAGHLEGDCQAGYGPQLQAHSWGHEVSPGQKDHTAWRPKLSHEAGEANLQRADGQRGGAAMRDDKNGGMIREKVPGQQDDTTSNCTHTVVPDTLKPQGEDTDFKVDSAKNSWRFQQHLQPRSQAQSGMSASYPPPSPQETPSTSNNLHLPASARQTSLFNSPQAPLETHNSYFSQQLWESSIIQSQQTQISCESNSGQLKQPQAPLNKEAHSACSQVVHSPLQTTLSHQPQKQQGHTAGNNNMTGTMITLASGKGPGLSSDVKTPSPAHQWQVPDPNLLGSRSSAGLMGNSQASNIYMQDNKDQAAGDDTTHSSNSERNDITSKYQSFFLTGIPAESLSSGVRPVPSCQDYMEDSSSSDDEGKLIIEL